MLRRNFPLPQQNNVPPAHQSISTVSPNSSKCFPLEIPQLAPKSLHFALRHAIICLARGGIAQLVERLNGIQEVRGSTPLISTIYPKDPIARVFFLLCDRWCMCAGRRRRKGGVHPDDAFYASVRLHAIAPRHIRVSPYPNGDRCKATPLISTSVVKV